MMGYSFKYTVIKRIKRTFGANEKNSIAFRIAIKPFKEDYRLMCELGREILLGIVTLSNNIHGYQIYRERKARIAITN